MIETLKALCGDETRLSISEPFAFRLGGYWWNAASNGHALIAVQAPNGELKREHQPPVEQLFQPEDAKATHLARFPDLINYLTDAPESRLCEACEGFGTHRCTCQYCEAGDEECEACEGDGEVPNVLPIAVHGLEIDRCILARYLRPFADYRGEVNVIIRGQLDPIEFRSSSWRVVVMPRKPEPGKELEPIREGLIWKVAL